MSTTIGTETTLPCGCMAGLHGVVLIDGEPLGSRYRAFEVDMGERARVFIEVGSDPAVLLTWRDEFITTTLAGDFTVGCRQHPVREG